ncbi:uncharacterized protein LOC128186824 isoform X2 [Crassostrea angulata]|uniref:uncharacterized protein LOC128186824 isoform X2 n=1 Tax=Magallana angulata TaxID=2784310 RepID=UPI0022B125C7|nr:uncharacterized protein LOC128186824 isoform X2 [Crassostrea angulata]
MHKCTFGSLFFMAGVSSVASIPANWTLSMNVCKIIGQRPAKDNDIVNKHVWIGAAKYRYNMDGSCPNTDDCEFCDIRMPGFKPSLNMLYNLTPNIKYVVADFSSIEELPEPNLCLLNTVNFTKEYVSCKMKYEDGCRSTDNFSNLKIILQNNHNRSMESSSESGLMKYRGMHRCVNVALIPLFACIKSLLPFF